MAWNTLGSLWSDRKPERSAASKEFGAVFRLAWPLALSQLGLNLLGFVDTFFAGELGKTALGAVAIGNSIFFGVTVLGMGVMMGLDAVASQAYGAASETTARRALWQATYLALPLSIILIGFMSITVGLLPRFGVVEDLVEGCAEYIAGRQISVLPWVWIVAGRSYLQAAERTKPIVFAMIVANGINAGADGVLIFGDDALAAVNLPGIGLPHLGAYGIGLASSIATFAQAAVLAAAVARTPFRSGARPHRDLDLPLMVRITIVGVPVALQQFAEVSLFTVTGILMGTIGTEVAAAHQVAITYASLSFALCVGVGAAAAVRFGRYVGAGDRVGARQAGIAALAVGGGIMTVSALCMVYGGKVLSGFMTDDMGVIEIASELLLIAAVFQWVDGVQAVAAGALRGAGLTRFALAANLVGHWLIGFPVGVGLAFVNHQGAAGLWWGLVGGLTTVAIALVFRLHVATRRGSDIRSVVQES